MKQLSLLVVSVFLCIVGFAQTNVIVTYTDETSETFTVSTTGKIYFESNNLLIDSGDLNPTSIDMDNIAKLQFEAVKAALAKALATSDVYVFPNPTTNVITIQGLETTTNIRIYSSVGKLVYSGSYEPNELMSLEAIPSGLYYVLVNNQHIPFSKR